MHERGDFDKAHLLKRQAEAEQARDLRKIIEALNAFYVHRQVLHDCRLIVYGRTIAGTSILEFQGAMSLIGQSPEIQRGKLAEYQEEMQAFTSFLKEQYFV